MNDPQDNVAVERPVAIPWYRQRIVLFICGSIVVAFIMVVIAMSLYVSSGAAKLDLSRPGYTSIQGRGDQLETFEGFSADGSVNRKTLDEFERLYDKQTKQVTTDDAFAGSAFEDQALGIDAPQAAE